MTAVASDEQTRDSLSDLDARVLAESLPHMVWVKGPDGATVYLNRKGIEFFGVGVEDTYGWSWLSLVHADDVDVVHSAWDKAMRGGTTTCRISGCAALTASTAGSRRGVRRFTARTARSSGGSARSPTSTTTSGWR